MNRFVTDNPQNNTENMLNLVFVKDKEVYVRGAGECDSDCRLIDFTCAMCAKNTNCDGSIAEEIKDDIDTFWDVMLDCAMDGCEIANAYFALIGFAEVRERLRDYENAGVMPDEIQKAVTAHWVDGCCSNCKTHAVTFTSSSGDQIHVETPHCPACGAKMNEKTD